MDKSWLTRAVAALALGGLIALGALFVVGAFKPPSPYTPEGFPKGIHPDNLLLVDRLDHLCEEVADLDEQIDLLTAPPGSGWLRDRQKELPGLKSHRARQVRLYNGVMESAQRAWQGGTYGLPAKITKSTPTCKVGGAG